MSEICHARLAEAKPRAETSDHRVAKDSARNRSSRRQAPASLRRGARLRIELQLQAPPYGPKPSSETTEHPRQAPAAPPARGTPQHQALAGLRRGHGHHRAAARSKQFVAVECINKLMILKNVLQCHADGLRRVHSA